MPNWCENELYVEGSKEELEKFVEQAKGEKVLDFNKFIPYPQKFAEADKKARKWEKKNPKSWENRPKDGYNSGGYEWCIKNWGTKWNACHLHFYEENPEDLSYKDEGKLFFKFDTAWSPPAPIVQKMGEVFPKLKFTLLYFECGSAFQGMLRIENGKVTEDKCTEYFGHRGG